MAQRTDNRSVKRIFCGGYNSPIHIKNETPRAISGRIPPTSNLIKIRFAILKKLSARAYYGRTERF
jgi:hypothetical protein